MEKEKKFLESVALGDYFAVRKWLGSGIPVHCRNDSGSNALSIAAQNGDATMVRLLLDFGINPYATDGGGNLPLISAAMECHQEVVALLLSHCKTISTRKHPSISAMMAANALESKGCVEVARMLRSSPG